MFNQTPRWTLTLAALTPALLAAGCGDPSSSLTGADADVVDIPTAVAEAQAMSEGAAFMRVLTRNIYLGGDASSLLTLNFQDIPGVLAAVNGFWAQVQENDFHERAQALAAEIAMTDPHVVALQEVARFAVVDGTFTPVGGLDMLQVLQSALADRGLDYQVAVVQNNTTGTLPMSIDFSTMTPDLLLNFTLREATLVRGDMDIMGSDNGNYAAKMYLPSASNPVVTLQRGWSRVDVNFKGVPHHVVNTHLEVQGVRPLHDAQADELVGAVVNGLDGVTVVLGDLNSDAAGTPQDPSWTPTYGKLVDAGFVDAWLQAAGNNGTGYTCCHDPDLRNDIPTLDERIDFVLVRAAGGLPGENGLPGAVRMTILGDESGDRTASGLWPADHAGLFAGLQIPRGLIQD